MGPELLHFGDVTPTPGFQGTGPRPFRVPPDLTLDRPDTSGVVHTGVSDTGAPSVNDTRTTGAASNETVCTPGCVSGPTKDTVSAF